jgi:hypothetical protein
VFFRIIEIIAYRERERESKHTLPGHFMHYIVLHGFNTMFVERRVCYSALFTNLVGWYTGTVSFPISDVILAQLACPLSEVMFCLHSGITNLSLYKHWFNQCSLVTLGLTFAKGHKLMYFKWTANNIFKGTIKMEENQL